eukprot:3446947-Amphidinium_carterae.1
MGGRPHLREEPSAEQLSGLAYLLRRDEAPYTDFAVWTADGRQNSRLMRFQAQVWIGSELVTKMLKGPPNFSAWLE